MMTDLDLATLQAVVDAGGTLPEHLAELLKTPLEGRDLYRAIVELPDGKIRCNTGGWVSRFSKEIAAIKPLEIRL